MLCTREEIVVSAASTRTASPTTAGWIAAVVAISLLASGCSSTPTVERRHVDEVIDLSGYWNDTDSRLVSEEMVGDCLTHPWSSRAAARLGREPVVIVGAVRNRTSEHLSTQTFVKDLERALVNSGSIRVVASRDERGELRDEREDQQRHASIETAKSMGQETGADYMLQGQINSTLDAAGKQQLRTYQVELELVDLENNSKPWIGQKKLKKTVTYKRTRF
jgi:uncharacterized protein (TIGR02722 family)